MPLHGNKSDRWCKYVLRRSCIINPYFRNKNILVANTVIKSQNTHSYLGEMYIQLHVLYCHYSFVISSLNPSTQTTLYASVSQLQSSLLALSILVAAWDWIKYRYIYLIIREYQSYCYGHPAKCGYGRRWHIHIFYL